MKIKVIENTNKMIFEENVNFFVQQVEKVFNIQYAETYLADRNTVLMSAMIIYEED